MTRRSVSVGEPLFDDTQLRQGPQPGAWVVVNDCAFQSYATREAREWWFTWAAHAGDRITWTDLTVGGGRAHIACFDREHAADVVAMLVEHGFAAKGKYAQRISVKPPVGGVAL